MHDAYHSIRKFIEPASELSSAAVGAAIGSYGGVQGAIIGALSAPVLKGLFVTGTTALGDVITGYRAKARAGLAAAYAINEIKAQVDAGNSPRTDNFFENTNARSSADEILEGVILKSKDEYEEKKARYVANILVTGIFDPSFSAEELHHLLKTTDQLTYRQLQLLSLFSQGSDFDLSDQNMAGMIIGKEKYSLVMEILALARRDLIEIRPNSVHAGTPLRNLPDFYPRRTKLTTEGERLCICMKLRAIDRAEISSLADLISRRAQ